MDDLGVPPFVETTIYTYQLYYMTGRRIYTCSHHTCLIGQLPADVQPEWHVLFDPQNLSWSINLIVKKTKSFRRLRLFSNYKVIIWWFWSCYDFSVPFSIFLARFETVEPVGPVGSAQSTRGCVDKTTKKKWHPKCGDTFFTLQIRTYITGKFWIGNHQQICDVLFTRRFFSPSLH